MRCCPSRACMGFSTDEPAQPRDAETRQQAARDAARAANSTSARSRSSCARCRRASTSWRLRAWRRCSSSCSPCVRTSAATARARARVKVREALKLMIEEEAGKLINEEELKIARAGQCRAERHRVHRRDRQDRAPPGNHRRRCLARGRAARPAAAGRRLARVNTKYGPLKTDHVLFIASGAFHHVQALGPDPGAAGPLADPRRARVADGGGLRAHPHRAGCLADRAVPGAAGHRGCGRWSSPPTACGASPRSRIRSTSAPRTSARAACTPSWSGCWRRSPSMLPSRARQRLGCPGQDRCAVRR